MNVDTGEIKTLAELTKEQKKSGKWLEIPRYLENDLKSMNRKERRKFLRENGKFKKGKWGWR